MTHLELDDRNDPPAALPCSFCGALEGEEHRPPARCLCGHRFTDHAATHGLPLRGRCEVQGCDCAGAA